MPHIDPELALIQSLVAFLGVHIGPDTANYEALTPLAPEVGYGFARALLTGPAFAVAVLVGLEVLLGGMQSREEVEVEDEEEP